MFDAVGTTEMEVKGLLLEKCREILTEIMQTPSDDYLGTPPQTVYIDYGPASKRKVGFLLKNIEETYCFDGKGISQVKAGTEFQREPISRMYFNEGHAIIGYEDDHAFLEFVVGPRYGRAFEFQILHDGDEIRLGKENLLWIS